MAESSEKRRPWINVIRWIAVLPAAILAWWLSGGGLAFLPSLIGIDLRGPTYPTFLFPLLFYLGSGFASTFVGGLIAPANRVVTSSVLAALVVAVSVQIHIVGQSRPGQTEYMHSTGEVLGAVLGLSVHAVLVLRTRSET